MYICGIEVVVDEIPANHTNYVTRVNNRYYYARSSLCVSQFGEYDIGTMDANNKGNLYLH